MKQIENAALNFDKTEVQARLNMLVGSSDNDFNSNTWRFESSRGKVTNFDFGSLEKIDKRYPKWGLTNQWDLILLSKQIWLSQASTTSFSAYSTRLDGINLLWSMMAKHNLSKLTKNDLPNMLRFFLTHTWNTGHETKIRKIKSMAHFRNQLRLDDWRLALAEIKIDLIAYDITETTIIKHLKKLIPELTDGAQTYADWFQGGSFDKLTLDNGQYYIEHSCDFFEQHYPLALAFARTYRATSEIAKKLNYKYATVQQAISFVLKGYSLEYSISKWEKWSTSTLEKIYSETRRFFLSEYRQSLTESYLLKRDTLESFVAACGNEPSAPNIDRMQVVVWDWLQRKDRSETETLLTGFQAKITWVVFETQLNLLIDRCSDQACNIPVPSEYLTLGLTKNNTKDSEPLLPRALFKLVAKVGLTNIVALTGWRRSEYGFPISSIVRTQNRDKLDQYSFPFRYQVDWFVFKTNGKVRLLREVTFGTVLLAERLEKLVAPKEDQPCLYNITNANLNQGDSSNPVNDSVAALWTHFVRHYCGFRLIDDWSSWKRLKEIYTDVEPLSKGDQVELDRLLSIRSENQWDNLSIDIQMQKTYREVREQLPRIEFFVNKRLSDLKKNNKGQGWVRKYIEGNLRSDWSSLLDTYLSDETRVWLRSLTKNDLKLAKTTKVVSSELMANTIYPNPHSFRHMWAEAVYRRFDGDVGWMIRSQFKHISKAMWLAYVRDKDNRRDHQVVKMHVINSLVYNFLQSKGEGYSGKFYIRLRRLLKKVSFLPFNEQERLVEKFAAEEIESIKANGWGYCMVLTKTRSKAKCAKNGEPQPYTAEPSLCLGCSHNLMQPEQIDWSLLNAATHIEVLRNPIVPSNFKEASYQLLKKTTLQVRNFNPDHEALEELDTVQKLYKESRAA